ncbi:hypothetical protein [Evansella clarkii]|jgi:hypothetical protein|uniref:hypothetical protein n=1 Tax=Evansella clarkii TaxID=79879 RepID=UPI00142FC224|nr:hypothetical protein [Evansella clarkii]
MVKKINHFINKAGGFMEFAYREHRFLAIVSAIIVVVVFFLISYRFGLFLGERIW